MRAVIQRVSKASVVVGAEETARIERGLLVLAGFEAADEPADLSWMAAKITNLRVFGDALGVMNRSVKDVDGDIIVVSQFTLHASTKKGNRPSYLRAAKSDISIPLYEAFVDRMEDALGKPVGTGIFGAHMEVNLINDGPVTIYIDTKNKE